ncbi:hypothetical protein DRO32_03765 [Candidatus Bathyarchaeota archaeon]|nr:MAG: hypothetical protein DRO32_03765 [Candidatus Bathyarchaeota archaeon]
MLKAGLVLLGLLAIVLTALVLPWQAPAAPTAAPAGREGAHEPRTYYLWSADLGAGILDMASVGEEEATVLLALNRSGGYAILALRAMSGDVLASSENYTSPLWEVLPIGEHVVVLAGWDHEHLLILGPDLSSASSIRLGQRPELLSSLPDGSLICLVNRTLMCFSLPEGGKSWSFRIPGSGDLYACITDGLVVVLCHEDGVWTGYVVDEEGSPAWPTGLGLPWLSQASSVDLTPYNDTHIILVALGPQEPMVYLVRSSDLRPSWSAEVEGLACLAPGLDMDGDGAPEILAVGCSGGSYRLLVLDGGGGSILGSYPLPAPPISLLQVGGDRLVLRYASRVELALMRGESGIEVLWSLECSMLEVLPDLDGDGFGELLLAHGGEVRCAWGSYDDAPPAPEAVWPPDGSSTSISMVVFTARVEDAGSGVADVFFVVDGRAVRGELDRASGLYVAEVLLGEGEHEWFVRAVDKVGYGGSTATLSITVNMSFFGEPGWQDDLLFFGPLVAGIALASVYVIKKMAEEAPNPRP